MRIAIVIIGLAAIAMGLVQMRRKEITAQHEIQRLRMEHVLLRRKLWDQQVTLGYLTGPQEIRRRMEANLLSRSDAREELARNPQTHQPDFGN